jgi:hypothetical protein
MVVEVLVDLVVKIKFVSVEIVCVFLTVMEKLAVMMVVEVLAETVVIIKLVSVEIVFVFQIV